MRRALCFWLFALTSACSKHETAPAAEEPAAKVGQACAFSDSTWTVLEAKDLGKSVRGNSPSIDPKETSGRFVLVRFSVTNKRKNPESVLEPPKLLDQESREIERVPMEALYVPKSAQTLGIEPLPPNSAREFSTLFDVPESAKNLKLQIRGLGLASGKRTIELAL